MSRGPIDGIHGAEEEESPRVKAWGQYQRHLDELDAQDRARTEEAAAEAARLEASRQRPARPAPVDAPPRAGGAISGATAAAGAAFAQGMREVLHQSPADRRMEMLAAMQAEALMRLEVAPHAEQAQGLQVEAMGGDAAARLHDRSLAESRRAEGEGKDREHAARRTDEARRPLPDKVAKGTAARRGAEEKKGGASEKE